MASSKALYSITVVILGFVCFIIGAIAVGLPTWGYFYNCKYGIFNTEVFHIKKIQPKLYKKVTAGVSIAYIICHRVWIKSTEKGLNLVKVYNCVRASLRRNKLLLYCTNLIPIVCSCYQPKCFCIIYYFATAKW